MTRIAVVVALALACGCSEPSRSGKRVRRPEAELRANRAYSGAPPVISHKVAELGRGKCLSCHLRGDALSDGRRAPPAPHPELERCEQCHVEQRVKGVFRASSFTGSFYRTGQRQQAKGPWLIPHPLTLRERCVACHASPTAPRWLRTTHPERGRCLQCHVPANPDWPGPRADRRTGAQLAERGGR